MDNTLTRLLGDTTTALSIVGRASGLWRWANISHSIIITWFTSVKNTKLEQETFLLKCETDTIFQYFWLYLMLDKVDCPNLQEESTWVWCTVRFYPNPEANKRSLTFTTGRQSSILNAIHLNLIQKMRNKGENFQTFIPFHQPWYSHSCFLSFDQSHNHTWTWHPEIQQLVFSILKHKYVHCTIVKEYGCSGVMFITTIPPFDEVWAL